MLEGYMTTTEAAKYLEYHSSSICYLCTHGKLPGATKFGKSWAIPKQSVYEYEKNGQGFATIKAQKEKEKTSWKIMLNAAIREGTARKAAQNLATA